ncbi:MAG: metal-dependent transcriptional regulator [Solirubrobacterales bacterium]
MTLNYGFVMQKASSSHARPGRSANSEAIEDYVKAIYGIAHHHRGHPVGTSELAQRLGVAPASATAMLKRLDAAALVLHEPYRGVSLTPAGERLAIEVIRHHRLLESYLSQALGMPWDKIHEEAEVLEHHISEELEALIAAKLGDPSHDPHGDPIPGADLAAPDEEGIPLHEALEGARVTFTRVSDSDPAMLRYLADRGILPGAELVVTGRQPFGGPLLVEVEGTEHALGEELVRRMRVTAKAPRR